MIIPFVVFLPKKALSFFTSNVISLNTMPIFNFLILQGYLLEGNIYIV